MVINWVFGSRERVGVSSWNVTDSGCHVKRAGGMLSREIAELGATFFVHKLTIFFVDMFGMMEIQIWWWREYKAASGRSRWRQISVCRAETYLRGGVKTYLRGGAKTYLRGDRGNESVLTREFLRENCFFDEKIPLESHSRTFFSKWNEKYFLHLIEVNGSLSAVTLATNIKKWNKIIFKANRKWRQQTISIDLPLLFRWPPLQTFATATIKTWILHIELVQSVYGCHNTIDVFVKASYTRATSRLV